jgi:hypothetical protein
MLQNIIATAMGLWAVAGLGAIAYLIWRGT